MSFHSGLVRHILHPLSLLKRRELAQLSYEREFAQSQYFSAEQLQDLQTKRLQRLLLHAYLHCPYYRKLFHRCNLRPHDIRTLADLRGLPVLEKQDIQRSFPHLVSHGWPASDLISNQTGGSTGTPISFVLSRDRKCSRAAATLRHNSWAGWRVGDRAAVIWGAPRDRPSTRLWSRLRSLALREPLWLDTACLTEQTMQEFLRQLHRFRPRIILSYARAAVLFARWLKATSQLPPSPHAIVTSAEVLEESDRQLLQNVFSAPIFNRYGCREVSVIASECEAHSGLHVMAEGLFVEIETPNGPAKPGQPGSILVTDLLNLAMPLIRYRIGDVGSWASGNCPCGRHLPRLNHVNGRVTDFLLGNGGRLVSGVFLATYVVAQRPSLGQVQIVQSQPDRLLYRIRPGQRYCPVSDAAYLAAATREFLGEGISSDIQLVSEFPQTPSGKFLFSQSALTPAWLSGVSV